ncbi:NotI family restriction endonuclease [Gluconobacter frateurii]|uniref:Restriction endonuclease type II NotI domain-containing protein n=1 Tax=Gluconobacter frateurii NRIC 0228 TaxID=1307946 RepID=A0ABQ0QC79_9PROT|nr:NotI family restriction endonuclease [Gluconobacter frateurii]GBR12811.1 hypothetical protein AA0228_1827 [Gluconobacter frateurii NRIC 0228]GLP89557.1 hypothetical protein GCM10007868_06320 [Gluconobacter frateurii]
MSRKKSTKALLEVFGFDPLDHTSIARQFWKLSACPFTKKSCTKYDHTRSICYGTCSVTNSIENVIICPNRLYEQDYLAIQRVSEDAFGGKEFFLFDQYIKHTIDGTLPSECVVALGHNSGKEVKITNMSMDWVLAYIKDGVLLNYVGIEVQSIDITGNYRDAWYAAKSKSNDIPAAQHGLNWANVHKRLIPQIIRKSLIYSKSNLVKNGLYFVVPDAVYKRFENIIGADIPQTQSVNKETITVHTYDLGPPQPFGRPRKLIPCRSLRFTLAEFSERFIAGPNLPSSSVLDNKIKNILACS